MISMYKYSLIGFLILLFGCQSIEENQKPEAFLNEDEMVNALTELAILKAAGTVASNDVKRDSGIDLKEYALGAYKLDSCVVAENIAYYGYKPQKLQKIYLRVQDNIEQRYRLHDSLFKEFNKTEVKKNKEKYGDEREED